MIENKRVPLAERLRPKTFEDFVGQEHITKKGSFLRRAIETGMLSSVIFFGPPGTGKTTLANIIANQGNGVFKKLNAVSSGVGDVKKIIEDARNERNLFSKQTYLLLDECHRWSKAQSDSILPAIEDGTLILIGTTTENPYFSLTPAILSRCMIFEFKSLDKEQIIKALKRALVCNEGLGQYNINIKDEALNYFAEISGGDLRSALNGLEMAFLTTNPDKLGIVNITKEIAEDCIQKKTLWLDESKFYDNLSAFCKSIRGSDPDAALFYCQRLIKAGCDPLIIARRLIAHCSEDIGMADSNALLLANCALYSLKNIGLPEGMLPLSHAIIYACTAEKSNSVYLAMSKAEKAVDHFSQAQVPYHLRNNKSLNDTKKIEYKYPHDFGGFVKQQYLPDEIKDQRFYIPSKNGKEKNIIVKK